MKTEDEPIVALFDLDGTLADHNGELRRRLALMRSHHEPEIGSDDSASWYESGPIQERVRLIRSNPGFWINLPELRAGFEILEEVHRQGCQIEILTKGPPTLADRLDGKASVVRSTPLALPPPGDDHHG